MLQFSMRKDRLRPRARQQIGTFDPVERRREKQVARDRDDEDLRTGRKTAEQLSRENFFMSSLNIDWAKAKIVHPEKS
jgi:hypothetical protein